MGYQGVLGVCVGSVALLAGAAQAQPAVESHGNGRWLDEADGGRRHLVTGLVCPARLASSWQLTSITEFGRPWDVGCNYDSPSGRVTLHAYHPGDTRQRDELRQISRPVIERAAPGTPLAESPAKIDVAGETLEGVRVEARPGGGRPVSAVTIADAHGWRVKVRETTMAPDDVPGMVSEFYARQTGLVGQMRNCAAWVAASGRDARRVTGDDAMAQGFIEVMSEMIAAVPATMPPEAAPEGEAAPPELVRPDPASACTLMVGGEAAGVPLLLRGYQGGTVISLETDSAERLVIGSIRQGIALEAGATAPFALVTREMPATFRVHRLYARRPSNQQAQRDLGQALSGQMAAPVSISPPDKPDGEIIILVGEQTW